MSYDIPENLNERVIYLSYCKYEYKGFLTDSKCMDIFKTYYHCPIC